MMLPITKPPTPIMMLILMLKAKIRKLYFEYTEFKK